jgi:hypothetical protein
LSAFDTYVGTTNGVFRLRDDAPEALGLESERVSAIHAWRKGDAVVVVLAGSYGNGLFRSEDGGVTWRELDGITRIDGHERWFLPDDPPRHHGGIARSRDGVSVNSLAFPTR